MRVMVMASGDLWAGAEVMVYQLVCGLVEISEIEICVVLLNRERLAKELEQLGVEVHVVDESRLSLFALARTVRKIVVDFAPDILHSHRYKENVLAWLSSQGKKKIKLVATQHGMPETTASGKTLTTRSRTGLFFRLLSFCFDCTVLVSGEMARALVGTYGFSDKDVIIIHNGIALPGHVSPPSGQRLMIGSAGRLTPVKDFSLLVDIARAVVSQNAMIDFVLAGDGPERDMLEEKVKRYGIEDRFRFLGHQDDMDDFYRGLDMYINTSVHEGIPMSVLEAMSYGLPVVVPMVGGFSEIVEDGVSGYLVVGREPVAFTDRIVQLINPEHRGVMGSAARKRIERYFSRDVMARQYYRLYKELVSG